jgi:23S rRNA (cytosine1962-C5)-methyltransferase
MLPCVIFEDDQVLVVDKPAGINTHAPDRFAGEGLYDWLRNREPRWASLAIIHRLDKETSGVMVFGKTALANRSLTGQFAKRAVQKTYLLLTDRLVRRDEWTSRSGIRRMGNRYETCSAPADGEMAETQFRVLRRNRDHTWLEAKPVTGRTHQIRVHAAAHGLPILGDVLYGGTPARRVCLHAAKIQFHHPVTREPVVHEIKASFFASASDGLRTAIADPHATNCVRLRHGASDGAPDLYADRLGDFLLAQGRLELADRGGVALLRDIARTHGLRGVYIKQLNRNVCTAKAEETSPRHVLGELAADRFVGRENGVNFELSFNEGYSVGLFLDQRDNRRRFLSGYVAPAFLLDLKGKEVLNTFAYTCGFSVCAALQGARVTSVDLSKKYLEWGKRNFALNDLDPAAHDFLYGDVFGWLRRLARKERAFDAVILDPPTFSQSKESGTFRVEKDYGKLVNAALPLVRSGGVLFASSNAAGWPPEHFVAEVEKSIRAERRKVLQRHYAPQPPDFPVSRNEPAYLKTIWLRIQ